MSTETTQLNDSSGTNHEQKTERNDMLDAALVYARRGWKVFPCHTMRATNGHSYCSCANSGCTSPGKHPWTKNGVKDATSDEQQIRAFWSKWPEANIGLATGAASGVVVLDVDPRHEGAASLTARQQELGSLPHTVLSLTGGDGFHYVFRHPGTLIKNSASGLGPGLDVRGDGGYIIAPPSLHKSGQRYRFDVGHAPSDCDPSPVPDAWLELMLPPQKPVRDAVVSNVDGAIPEGRRNETLLKFAGSMRRKGMDADEIFAGLRVINAKRCAAPLDEAELRTIAQSVMRYEPAAPVTGASPGFDPVALDTALEAFRSAVTADAEQAIRDVLSDQPALTAIGRLIAKDVPASELLFADAATAGAGAKYMLAVKKAAKDAWTN